MQGYSHTENSLYTILERLKNLNVVQNETLSDMHAQQVNQVSNLSELGMVLPSPAKDNAGQPGVNGVVPAKSLVVSIMEEIDRLQQSMDIAKMQVEDARFIGEALYRQMAVPAPTTAVAGGGRPY